MSHYNVLDLFPIDRTLKAGYKPYWLEIVLVPSGFRQLSLFRAYGYAKDNWTLKQLLHCTLKAKKLNLTNPRNKTFYREKKRISGDELVKENLYFCFIEIDDILKIGKGICLEPFWICDKITHFAELVFDLMPNLYFVHNKKLVTLPRYYEILGSFHFGFKEIGPNNKKITDGTSKKDDTALTHHKEESHATKVQEDSQAEEELVQKVSKASEDKATEPSVEENVTKSASEEEITGSTDFQAENEVHVEVEVVQDEDKLYDVEAVTVSSSDYSKSDDSDSEDGSIDEGSECSCERLDCSCDDSECSCEDSDCSCEDEDYSDGESESEHSDCSSCESDSEEEDQLEERDPHPLYKRANERVERNILFVHLVWFFICFILTFGFSGMEVVDVDLEK
ncbi:unnamed protein product [Bursaphelenchus okinawaensis]|uniref:Uncharacterized protein n=1 Tax=Bursaphelenchus okinawaensis TaxID=465554 RepID=A0A811KM81_9BILA|nr:unnamed protein product [Bursaphelenchus okinawaensis]CAG9105123.1 unnamed protein product [Bursaphelenchus okinawaensis]